VRSFGGIWQLSLTQHRQHHSEKSRQQSGSSYTAEDADIIGANEDYKALEAELRSEIDNIESTHSGYEEYRYNLAEINHNPYVLTSYLTVKYEDYTRAEVQSELQALFDKQYELELEEEVEIRTRTETRTGTTTYTDPETGETEEEEYEYEEYPFGNIVFSHFDHFDHIPDFCRYSHNGNLEFCYEGSTDEEFEADKKKKLEELIAWSEVFLK